MANAINWFEIPASNLERAKKFYSEVFSTEMVEEELMGIKMAFFNATDNGVGGALCSGEGYEPSTKGTLPYLNGGDNLDQYLQKVNGAGGKVLMPKTQISEEIGYMAMFLDSEGNRIALHSNG